MRWHEDISEKIELSRLQFSPHPNPLPGGEGVDSGLGV
jgi:hypothetical protein